MAFAVACLSCLPTALVHAAPPDDPGKSPVTATVDPDPTTTKGRSPQGDFGGRDPGALLPPVVDTSTPREVDTTTVTTTTPPSEPSSNGTTTPEPAPSSRTAAELPEGFLPPDTTAPTTTTTPRVTTSVPTTTKPATATTPTTATPTTAPREHSDRTSEVAPIPGGGPGADRPSGYLGGAAAPARPGHHSTSAFGHPGPDLATTANSTVAAGGVATLGALGLLAGFLAYRGALQAQQRRTATRAALFGPGGGIG